MIHQQEMEQLEQLRQLWRSHGKWVLLAFGLSLLFVFAWQLWSRHEMKQQMAASQEYQLLLDDWSNHRNDHARQIAETIIQYYPRTPYAPLSAFLLADEAVRRQNYGDAEKNLTWAMKHARERAIRQIAAIRLARVLAATYHYDDALRLVKKPLSKTFKPIVEEVKGDIYMAKGEKEDAKTAYASAIESLYPKVNGTRPILEMKYSDAGGDLGDLKVASVSNP